MKQFFVIILSFTVALSGCSVIQKSTPIPEKPLAQMTPQPPESIAGDDSIGDAYIPSLGNTGYDVQQYNLAMAFSSQLDVITATITISSVVTLDNLGRISLDFTGYQVDAVRVGKKYAAYYRSPDKLYIDLPKVAAEGQQLVIQVAYHGSISTEKSAYMPITELGLRTFAGKNLTYAMAEPDGAHDWFPCNDHPLDKATYRFELTVPKGITAVANGTLIQNVTTGDQETFTWSEPDPMATYLATVVVGNYERIDAPAVGNVKIRHYVITGDADFSDQLAITQDILQYYSDLIGPYPFDEMGFIVVLNNSNEPSFGMETQTMIMISRDFLFGSGSEGILAHEAVHQWFGDSVSVASWNDVWLKEGLADYLMYMWLDHQGLEKLSTLLSGVEDYLVAPGHMVDQPLDQPSPDFMYAANTYVKGAWVFHMLRQQIGDDNFTRFLQAYYQRYAGGNASTADLQQVAEEISGQDLDQFFQQWVYGTGFPSLQISWTNVPGGVAVQVCQHQSGPVFILPLEVTLTAGEGVSQDQLIQVDEQGQQVTYPVSFDVARILADPNQDLLANIYVSQVDQLSSCIP